MTPKTILGTLLLVGFATTASAEPVGFIAGLRGQVDFRAGQNQIFRAATLDGDISQGDVIRTARNAWAKVVLNDDTTFAVDEETELVFDRYVLGWQPGDEPSVVEIVKGHVRTKVGETFGGEDRLQLITPTAVMGVKGTEWLAWVEIDATWVCVIEGIVRAANRAASIGGAIDLGAGQCARIGRDEEPERTPHPGDLVPTAMQTPLQEATGLPASLEPVDRTIITINDEVPTFTPPEPDPVPVRVERVKPGGGGGAQPSPGPVP